MAIKERRVDEYVKENKEFFSQPIVKKFFESDPEHSKLLHEALKAEAFDTTCKESIELNKRFTRFFLKYRLVSYIATLSHRYSQYFDKEKRKFKKRYQLSLNKPAGDNEKDLHVIDLIESENLDMLDKVLDKTDCLTELIADEVLFNAIYKLTQKQRKVLYLVIIENMKVKEVAEHFNDSP
ncbi:hypothetical protein PRVXT_000640 [Proteinivorax tanatarense]|uniref:Sigma-70 family RNA polymerase sigma factor n=1 Tax=Proteinivorax tanatarense TaxID=1260629 RepID=A0AAU7VN73_9FIRM